MLANTPISLWEFEEGPDLLWTWTAIDPLGNKAHTAMGFLRLDEAVPDATSNGFDASLHDWSATIDGQTTHYHVEQSPPDLAFKKRPGNPTGDD
jgi:hypothetical protein